jgi:mannosyl-3-phosphoglycerate phosphatase
MCAVSLRLHSSAPGQRRPSRPGNPAPPCTLEGMDIVVTDLDGTLLDEETYSFEAARPGLAVLKSRMIPLVFCTSKTRSEVEYWRNSIGNGDPFIVENGAAVYIPEGHFEFPIPGARHRGAYDVLQLGTEYAELVSTLENASVESACRIRGFHEMTAAEVSALCGLGPELAEMAKRREFDEPFVVLDPERERELVAAIERAGKQFTRGGRFCHITGNNDKALALRRLLELYRRLDPGLRTVGLGDGLNDARMLNAVDVAILIRSRGIDRLQAAVPQGKPTVLPGPAGWNEAITALMRNAA